MAVQYSRGDRGDSHVLGGGTFDLVALHRKGRMINWRSHSWYQWLIVALFLLVAGFTLSKSVHTVREVIYWQAHQDEPIRGWMSVGYVAHSYRVPAEVLSLSLGLSLKQPD